MRLKEECEKLSQRQMMADIVKTNRQLLMEKEHMKLMESNLAKREQTETKKLAMAKTVENTLFKVRKTEEQKLYNDCLK